MDFFEKNLSQLTADDIDWLVESEIQEGQDIDFKRDLPTENGQKDRWHSKGDKIGDYAKTLIVREIVAFANAQGGSLVLGVDESADKPSRAAKLAPIPNAIELADRLRWKTNERLSALASRAWAVLDDHRFAKRPRICRQSPCTFHDAVG